MQTFLPYPDFEESAAVLDRQRLGKQRVETLQIMTALVRWRGWVHHTATRMWAGHEFALMMYQVATCNEWTSRGYADTCLVKTARVYEMHTPRSTWPPWLGDDDLHLSHQSNLVAKDPEYYRPLFPDVPDDLPYLWPTREI